MATLTERMMEKLNWLDWGQPRYAAPLAEARALDAAGVKGWIRCTTNRAGFAVITISVDAEKPAGKWF